MITLPEAFEQEMKQLLGEEEYEAYRKTFDEAVHRGLRVNNGKISTEEFLRRTDIPLKKVPWIPNGFYYDEESCNPAKDADYYAGLYYLQEPSAMTPASRLPIEPDDRVMRYLKGETLSFSEEECQGKKGWVLVCLDDFPLGWGKINNGTLKNKYYAGWRMV